MGRWQPDSANRLQLAAIDLYAERGYEDTTVAEIAERAGLTERTFFRHFADKREVLFRGSDELLERLVVGTRAAPAGTPPVDAVVAAVVSLSPFFDENRSWSARRRAVIAGSPELQERELMKRVTLVAGVSEALRARGEDPETARLAAEVGITTFHVAYDRWADDPRERGYAEHARMTLAELRATCAETARPVAAAAD